MGKNFDATGAFGPELVSADELPPGAAPLRITARVDGQTVQDSTTGDMIFPVARIISIVSEVMTLEPGDVIATGTPSGVGYARKPPLFLAPGMTVEVEVEGIGVLRNTVADGPSA
jgi:2-keto-4-pentenoate hydratase/2-oxohepta-3-ene-1,7-dioic acid hydratase in catechol pathway